MEQQGRSTNDPSKHKQTPPPPPPNSLPSSPHPPPPLFLGYRGELAAASAEAGADARKYRRRLFATGGVVVLSVIAFGAWYLLNAGANENVTAAAPAENAETRILGPSRTDEPTSVTTTGSEPAPTAPSTVISLPIGDLQLPARMSVPQCDGTGIVVLYSATNPESYVQEIADQLLMHPGSLYLRTDNACTSLRQRTNEGNAIYAVYRPAGTTEQSVCTAVAEAGGDSYGKWLDSSTDPSYIIPC